MQPTLANRNTWWPSWPKAIPKEEDTCVWEMNIIDDLGVGFLVKVNMNNLVSSTFYCYETGTSRGLPGGSDRIYHQCNFDQNTSLSAITPSRKKEEDMLRVHLHL